MQYVFEPVRPTNDDVQRALDQYPGARIVTIVPNRAKAGSYFALLETSSSTAKKYLVCPCQPTEADVQRVLSVNPGARVVDMTPNNSRPGMYYAVLEVIDNG